jgi:hypothetical protein
MTVFRGSKNLRLGQPAWAVAEYDHEAHGYVVTLDGDDAERFRAVADLYGFREVGADEAEPETPADDGGDNVEGISGKGAAPTPEGDGHEREFVDLAHAIDNARDDDELDESGDDDDADDKPEPEPAKPVRRGRRQG